MIFGKLLNIMVLQKCVPAKSHVFSWDLAWTNFHKAQLINQLEKS